MAILEPQLHSIGSPRESSFSTLKLELDLRKSRGKKLETQALVFKWIEVFCNRPRPKSASCCGQGQEAVTLELGLCESSRVQAERLETARVHKTRATTNRATMNSLQLNSMTDKWSKSWLSVLMGSMSF
jgi:hypothetical protein